jgi:hypothetical protein
MGNQITTKEELLSRLLLEIEQLTLPFMQGGDAKQMYVSSESSLYPPYIIDVRSKPCNWMMGDDRENCIVVNVLFLRTAENVKGRYVFIDPNELIVKNVELKEAMSILVEDVFDDSSGYDTTLYPSEIEARNTLRKIIGDGDSEDDDVDEDTQINKEEIESVVDGF